MKYSLVEKLCCPFDKNDLELKVMTKDIHDNITEGLLTCSHCKRYFPIIYGVPIMSPDEYREPALEAPVMQRWENKLEGMQAKNFRLLSNSNEEINQ